MHSEDGEIESATASAIGRLGEQEAWLNALPRDFETVLDVGAGLGIPAGSYSAVIAPPPSIVTATHLNSAMKSSSSKRTFTNWTIRASLARFSAHMCLSIFLIQPARSPRCEA